MRDLKTIEAKYISRSDSRPIDKATVEKLSESIKEIGLLQPITVKEATVMISGVAGDGYKVVAGNHRLEALKSAGILDVEAFVLRDLSWADSELREIDENLIRAELTPSQRAHAIRRRKEIWTQRHGEEESEVAQSEPPQSSEQSYKGHLGGARPQRKEFASDTSQATGEAKSSINRHVSRAEALGDDLNAVTGTSLDKGVELDALKGMTPEERKPLIDRAQAGEKVSARDVKGLDARPEPPKPKTFRLTLKKEAQPDAESIIAEMGEEYATELAQQLIAACGHNLEVEQ